LKIEIKIKIKMIKKSLPGGMASTDGCSESRCKVGGNPSFIYLLEHPLFYGRRVAESSGVLKRFGKVSN
jgi:hypothetical protein